MPERLNTFHAALDSELANVNAFNERKIKTLKQDVEAFESMYSGGGEPTERVRNLLVDLNKNLCDMRSFIALNYLAVVKILKKQAKNFPSDFKAKNPAALLLQQPFYTSITIGSLLNRVDKLSAIMNKTEVSTAKRSWVLSSNGPHEAQALLSSATGMLPGPNTQQTPNRATGVPSPQQKTMIVALWGMRMDALLLTDTPNIDKLSTMTPSFARHLESPAMAPSGVGGAMNKLTESTLETLWSTSEDTVSSSVKFGSHKSKDSETIEKAVAYLRGESTPSDTIELHLNGTLKAGSQDIADERFIESIKAADVLLGDLITAMSASANELGNPKAWTALVCSDSSSTESANTSAMLQLAPAALTLDGGEFEAEDMGQNDDRILGTWEVVAYAILALGFLYGFLFGLDLMGAAFKVLGGKSAGDLFSSIDNPVAGLMVGILATVLVQSSSTSTSVVVGMVGSDIISVETAIPIIMGANIGTSVTNTIMSMGQMDDPGQYKRAFAGATVHDCFNLLNVAVFLPIECVTHMLKEWTELLTDGLEGGSAESFKSPLKTIVSPYVAEFITVDKKKINKIAEGKLTADNAGYLTKSGWFSHEHMDEETGAGLCLGISLLMLCICLVGIVYCLKKLVMGQAKEWITNSLRFTEEWWGGLIAMAVGMGATLAVQSSSITTSTLTPLVGVGIITLEQMLPLTLGANVGTTITGILAAMVSAKRSALQIALAHLSFNVFGILVWYPFLVMRNIPLDMARVLGTMAFHFKWFPPMYIFTMFITVPLVFLGISKLYTSGPAGIAFGVICTLILLALITYAAYLYYYKGGRAFLFGLVADAGEKVKGMELEEEDKNVHTDNNFTLDVEVKQEK